MAKSDTTLIAIGGGSSNYAIIDIIFSLLAKLSDPRVVVMTVAANNHNGMRADYNSMFRKRNVRHVEMVDISVREDAFNKSSLKKVENADLLYFTGGDQLNVTSLLGGSPLDHVLHERFNDGVVIAGTSAGAAMMPSSMITGGGGGTSPKVGCVETSSGLNLIENVIIDTHFAERGRHGRLLTAIAHYPQMLGIGIDESTAVVVRGNNLKVAGKGSVTIIDGSTMRHTDLVFRTRMQPIGMFDVRLHVLSADYTFDLKTRTPEAPASATLRKALKSS